MVLTTATQASWTAKKLRQSADELTKRQVFIGPNLTKAEAKAGYELRCQRKLIAGRRKRQQSSTVPPAGFPPVAPSGDIITPSTLVDQVTISSQDSHQCARRSVGPSLTLQDASIGSHQSFSSSYILPPQNVFTHLPPCPPQPQLTPITQLQLQQPC